MRLAFRLLLSAAIVAASCLSFGVHALPMSEGHMSVKYAHGLAHVSFGSSGLMQPSSLDLLSVDTVAGTRLFVLNITSNPMVFPIVNVRQPVVVRYLQAKPEEEKFVEVSRSASIVFDAQQPDQGHIALTQKLGEMAVTWVSNATTNAQVRWGLSETQLDQVAAATGETYTIAQLCATPATDPKNFLDPGTIYTAVLSGLPTTGQNIFYQYGSPAGGWSNITSFHMVAAGKLPFNFTAFGDMGVSPGQRPAPQTSELILGRIETTDLVVHIGDVSYARGYAYIWDAFFHEIEPIATRVPYMVGIGNHEYDYIGQPFKPSWSTYGTDSGGECGIPYMSRLPMPISNPTAPYRDRVLYYSFSYGPVHFAMLDSEVDYLNNSAQRNWLEADLASVDRSVTPFVVVTNHRPMYDSSSGAALPEVREVRTSIEPLLVKYAVDLVLVGHVHVYQRSCRVLEEKCDDKGPVHMTIGMAGNTAQGPWLPEPDWVQARSLNFGVTFFQVVNSTAMFVQFQRDSTGAIEDEFWVYRK